MTDAIATGSEGRGTRLFEGRMLLDIVKDDIPPGTAPLSLEDWRGMSEDERLDLLDWFLDELAQTTEGVTIQFPRIKYPSSGTEFWQIDTGDEKPTPVAELAGVILTKAECRVYFPPDESGEDTIQEGAVPLCVSADCIRPDAASQEKQSDTCASCKQAQWGSGKGGAGQACKKRVRVYQLLKRPVPGKSGMVCDGPLEEVPTFISLPPTSIKPFSAYVTTLAKAKRPLSFQVTKFGLEKATSRQGKGYSALDPHVGPTLTLLEAKKVKEIKALYGHMMRYRTGKDLIADLGADAQQHDPAMDFPGTGPDDQDEQVL